MYALYKRFDHNGKLRLIWDRDISLAGCNVGIIPQHLKEIIIPEHKYPIGWTIPIAEKYHQKDHSVIIDIKPTNSNEIFLCELDTAFGFCYEDFTPVMYRLINLNPFSQMTVNNTKYEFPYPKDLTYNNNQAQVIYMMYYMQGSIQNGRITGSWLPPKNGITTNTSILWPEAMSFFNAKIKEFDPDLVVDQVTEIR